MDCGFQIITDSTCDLPKSWLAKHPFVTVVDVPVIVTKGSESHILRDLGPNDFYAAEVFVEQGFRASTSHPAMYSSGPEAGASISVEDIVRKNVAESKDVIYIVMNSALSGAYGTATPLFQSLQKEYGDNGRRIICVDSRCMSTGLALLLLDIADGVKDGSLQNVDQIAEFVERHRDHIGHYFTWGELSYIKKSGRVGAIGALLGNFLGIRLVCSAQYCDDGERRLELLTPTHSHVSSMIKVRGIGKWAEVIGTYAERHIVDPNGKIIIAHGNVPRDAHIVESHLRKHLPNAKYIIGDDWRCGAGIQAHGGPTSIHVNFHVDRVERLDKTIEEICQIIHGISR
jgi:DegV family protein with EDD domain